MIVIMYEGNQGLRQIFTDGRKVPELNDDLQPWWYGYSAGHWEGDTLVVETVGFRDDVWLDVNGSPLTSAGRMTERFRRPNFGLLQIDVTIDDPNGLHEAVHGPRQPAPDRGRRAHRVHLQRERAVVGALRPVNA